MRRVARWLALPYAHSGRRHSRDPAWVLSQAQVRSAGERVEHTRAVTASVLAARRAPRAMLRGLPGLMTDLCWDCVG